MKIFIEIVGWYGTVAIVLAYAMVSFAVFGADSAIYQILNLTGAVGIVINSLFKRAYPSAALNVIWTIIAAFALVRMVI